MISSGPLEDRIAIRELVESYNDAVMRFDGDAWADNWRDDATWHLPGVGPVNGKENFFPVWQQAMSAFEFVGFFASAGPGKMENLMKSTAIAKKLQEAMGSSVSVWRGISGEPTGMVYIEGLTSMVDYGKSIDVNRSYNIRNGDDNKMNDFLSNLSKGNVSSVIFMNCNPVYDSCLLYTSDAADE